MDPTATENEIRARLQASDSSALAMIWDAYFKDLLSYLISILSSHHDAEDVLQDVFITIARKRETVAAADKLKPYLFSLARNAAINRIKRDGRMRKREQHVPEWLEPVAPEGSPERTAAVQQALEALPATQRAVIVMKFFRTKSLREIGELLGISENTAGSRYRYGMDKLRSMLREDL